MKKSETYKKSISFCLQGASESTNTASSSTKEGPQSYTGSQVPKKPCYWHRDSGHVSMCTNCQAISRDHQPVSVVNQRQVSLKRQTMGVHRSNTYDDGCEACNTFAGVPKGILKQSKSSAVIDNMATLVEILLKRDTKITQAGVQYTMCTQLRTDIGQWRLQNGFNLMVEKKSSINRKSSMKKKTSIGPKRNSVTFSKMVEQTGQQDSQKPKIKPKININVNKSPRTSEQLASNVKIRVPNLNNPAKSKIVRPPPKLGIQVKAAQEPDQTSPKAFKLTPQNNQKFF